MAATSRAFGDRASMMCCLQATLSAEGLLEYYFAMAMMSLDLRVQMAVPSKELNSGELRCVPAMRRMFVDKIRRLRRRVHAQHLDCKSFDRALVAYKDDANDEVREQRAVIRFCPTKGDMDCQGSMRGWMVHLCFLCLPCRPTTKSSVY